MPLTVCQGTPFSPSRHRTVVTPGILDVPVLGPTASLGAVGRVSVLKSPRHTRSDRHIAPSLAPLGLPPWWMLGGLSSQRSECCSLGPLSDWELSLPQARYCHVLPSTATGLPQCTSLPSGLANSIGSLPPSPVPPPNLAFLPIPAKTTTFPPNQLKLAPVT